MLRLALILFLISLVAGIFGFTNLAIATAAIAQVIFYIFLTLFVIVLILALVLFRKQ